MRRRGRSVLQFRRSHVTISSVTRPKLLRYYSRECLWSAAARAGWIDPDLCPLDF